MAFAPSAFWNSRSITHLANYLSPSLPMNSSDESIFPAASVRDKNSEQPCLKGVCGVHDNRVHWLRMKNITLSADEQLIEQARLLAKSQHKTLNAMFREWLEQFTAQSGGTKEFDALMKRLKHVQAGRRFSREEMNER